jgi:general secretion pathway protein K
MRSRQQGLALISVLLVLSVALLITASLLRGHRLLIHSVGQQLDQLALRQAALAGESLALVQLRQLSGGRAGSVHPGQAWATQPGLLELDATRVRVVIEDLSGRFNLNSLLGSGPPPVVWQQRWTALLAGLQLDVIDLRSGNGSLLGDVSQLRRLPGVDGAWLAGLAPYVATLPFDATLNVNTVGVRQLMMLGLSAETANAVLAQRPEGGHDSVAAFLSQPLLDGLTLGGQGLGVSSRWFRIRVDTALGDRRLRLLSDVQLDPGQGSPRILQRRLVAAFDNEFSL